MMKTRRFESIEARAAQSCSAASDSGNRGSIHSRAGEEFTHRCSMRTSPGSIARSRTSFPTSHVGWSVDKDFAMGLRERFGMFALRIGGAVLASILVLCSGVTEAGGTQPNPRLGDLLQRHRLAMGNLDAASARWDGTIEQNGVVGKYSLIADIAGRYRLGLMLPLSSRAEGNDGTTGWREDENGNVQLLPGERPRALAARLLGFNALVGDRTFHGELGPLTSVDGKSAYLISSTLRSGAAKFYLDSRSFMLDGVDIGDRVIRYSGYKKFGDVQVPSRVVETQDASTVTTTVESVRLDVPLQKAYAVPQSREPIFADGKQDVALNYDPVGSLIVVPSAVNGKPARFLIDSGSTSSVIDLESARRLGLATAGTARVEGAAVLVGTEARLDELTVGGVTLRPFIMQAVPLNLPAPIVRSRVDGVLGYDFLAQLVVRLAPDRGQIRFIEARSFKYTGTGAVLQMDESDRVPRIQTTIGNRDKVTLQVDTGSDANLVFFADYANAHMLDFSDPADMGQDYARGAGGAFPIRFRQLTRLNIGDFFLADLLTQIVVHPVGAFSPTRADGMLGMGSLARFAAVFLDYPGKRIIFER